jgi:hypothetical protein
MTTMFASVVVANAVMIASVVMVVAVAAVVVVARVCMVSVLVSVLTVGTPALATLVVLMKAVVRTLAQRLHLQHRRPVVQVNMFATTMVTIRLPRPAQLQWMYRAATAIVVLVLRGAPHRPSLVPLAMHQPLMSSQTVAMTFQVVTSTAVLGMCHIRVMFTAIRLSVTAVRLSLPLTLTLTVRPALRQSSLRLRAPFSPRSRASVTPPNLAASTLTLLWPSRPHSRTAAQAAAASDPLVFLCWPPYSRGLCVRRLHALLVLPVPLVLLTRGGGSGCSQVQCICSSFTTTALWH